LLAFWGAPNLQVVNKAAHLDKCAEEAAERARRRIVVSQRIKNSEGDPQP
jgi:hypothetical protein